MYHKTRVNCTDWRTFPPFLAFPFLSFSFICQLFEFSHQEFTDNHHNSPRWFLNRKRRFLDGHPNFVLCSACMWRFTCGDSSVAFSSVGTAQCAQWHLPILQNRAKEVITGGIFGQSAVYTCVLIPVIVFLYSQFSFTTHSPSLSLLFAWVILYSVMHCEFAFNNHLAEMSRKFWIVSLLF